MIYFEFITPYSNGITWLILIQNLSLCLQKINYRCKSNFPGILQCCECLFINCNFFVCLMLLPKINHLFPGNYKFRTQMLQETNKISQFCIIVLVQIKEKTLARLIFYYVTADLCYIISTYLIYLCTENHICNVLFINKLKLKVHHANGRGYICHLRCFFS